MDKYLIIKINFDRLENYEPEYISNYFYADTSDEAENYIAKRKSIEHQYSGYWGGVYPKYQVIKIQKAISTN